MNYDFLSWCQRENLGSFRKIELLPTDWIDLKNYNDIITLDNRHLFQIPVLSPFQSNGDGGWIQIPILPTRGRVFDEQFRPSRQGDHYIQRATGIYPGNHPQVRATFRKMIKMRYIARITDTDDTLYLMGTLDRPCTLSPSFTTGPSRPSLKHWNISLRTNGLDPAPHIELAP